ncbi:Gfo/Idh/MocA family protein [Legionella sp. W05-934-2]|uniref:Gfo/Idh/MocA family protein n=1 Tax=Legionella sp. W05-934-2 TaxID=1198649 RepID=UPI003461B6F1
MKSIKIAIIGAGNMAREHIKAFQAIENVTIAGIHSRTYQRASELAIEFHIPINTSSIGELHQATQADLVIVTVPELQANKVAKECFKFDWTVLLEKPAGYHLKDAYDIAEASLTCKKPTFVGLNRRFYDSSRKILDDLAQKNEARYVHIQDQQSYEEARHYNHPEEVVENFMYANSIHNIDLINYFCRGDIIDVNPIVPWQGEASQIALAYITFSSGDSALYEGIWKGPGPWACTVSTPSRRWVMQPLETASFQNAGERKLNSIEINSIDKSYKAGFYLQAQEICKAVRNEPNNAITIKESLKTMELISQIFNKN